MLKDTSRTGRSRPRLVSKPTFSPMTSSSGDAPRGTAGLADVLTSDPFTSISLTEFWIERVAGGFPDQVIRKHGEKNGKARKHRDPPDEPSSAGPRLLQEGTPAGLVYLSKAEEAERRFVKDRAAHAEGRRHENRRQAVRKEMPKDDSPLAEARGNGGLNKIALPQTQELGADESGVGGVTRETNDRHCDID